MILTTRSCPVCFALILKTSVALRAGTIDASSVDDFKRAIDGAKPGDHIVLADGRYNVTDTITIGKSGTAEQPIVIEPKSIGGAEITGDAGFRIEKPAAYVVVRGFVFTHKAGSMHVGAGVHHCRITRNVFALKVEDRATYLSIAGDDNEIDHNTFRDKDTEGQMLIVDGPNGSTVAQRTWIHHNAFLDFKQTHKNNASGLHIGSSGRSMSSSFSVVEHNLFVRNVGENEGAICNKSSDNIYRFNTIIDSTELSLRHGHRCQVYGNFILNSQGLRFFANDHQIYSNYFSGNKPALAIGNGDATIPPGALTSHQRPDRVQVVFNTFVNNTANVQMGGRNNGLGANDLVFANNIIVGGNQAVSIKGPLGGNPKWEGNIVWNTEGGPGDIPASGLTSVDPKLAKDDAGIYRLSQDSSAAGKNVGSYPFVTIDLSGRTRSGAPVVGAEEPSSTDAKPSLPLAVSDVGPGAPEEKDRPLISAPEHVRWIPHEPEK